MRKIRICDTYLSRRGPCPAGTCLRPPRIQFLLTYSRAPQIWKERMVSPRSGEPDQASRADDETTVVADLLKYGFDPMQAIEFILSKETSRDQRSVLRTGMVAWM